MDQSFHTIIIGGGPGGAKAAKILAKAGKKVVLLAPEMGGECLNYGCIPTKSSLWAVELFEKLGRARELGLDISEVKLNWPKMQERRKDVVAKLKKNLAWSVSQAGVQIIEGMGKLRDAHTVEVTSASGTETLSAEHIILATGSEARMPPGFEKSDRVLTNHEILDLPTVPSSLLIVGGGAIGVEFASLFSALGSKVTIAEMGPRLLAHMDSDLSAELERVFARKGMEIKKNAALTPQELMTFEKVLVAAGRKPTVENLGLENAGVESTAHGITTNEHLQTNLLNIYAIGDVAGKALLAYSAEREGEVAANTILGKNPMLLRYETISNTIFSLPEVASVGLTEEEAKKRGMTVAVGKSPMSANAKALIIDGRDGFAKVIMDQNTRALLGVHLVGEKASELIAEASLALSANLSLDIFRQNLHSHPILGEVIQSACDSFTE